MEREYRQWGWDIPEVVGEVTQLLSVQRGGYLSWGDWRQCIRDADLELSRERWVPLRSGVPRPPDSKAFVNSPQEGLL